MNELKNLKKKYPSKKNNTEDKKKLTNNENEIKNEDTNNILTLQNKYNKFNDLLKNNIHIYDKFRC